MTKRSGTAQPSEPDWLEGLRFEDKFPESDIRQLTAALEAWKRWAAEAERRGVTQPLWAALLLEEAHRLTDEALS